MKENIIGYKVVKKLPSDDEVIAVGSTFTKYSFGWKYEHHNKSEDSFEEEYLRIVLSDARMDNLYKKGFVEPIYDTVETPTEDYSKQVRVNALNLCNELLDTYETDAKKANEDLKNGNITLSHWAEGETVRTNLRKVVNKFKETLS